MDDLVAFVRQQLDEDERWARAASQAYRYAEGNPAPPENGVHWTWVKGEDWEPTQPDPVTEEFVGGEPGVNVNLATVEQWPTPSWGIPDAPERLMPQTYANSIVEMDPSAAGHIARWDPSRVLAEVEAKRRILDEVLRYEAKIDGEWGCVHSAEQIGAGQCPDIRPSEVVAIRLLAQPYARQPGWREEWAV